MNNTNIMFYSYLNLCNEKRSILILYVLNVINKKKFENLSFIIPNEMYVKYILKTLTHKLF